MFLGSEEAKDILLSSSLWSPKDLYMAWSIVQLLGFHVPRNNETMLRQP